MLYGEPGLDSLLCVNRPLRTDCPQAPHYPADTSPVWPLPLPLAAGDGRYGQVDCCLLPFDHRIADAVQDTRVIRIFLVQWRILRVPLPVSSPRRHNRTNLQTIPVPVLPSSPSTSV